MAFLTVHVVSDVTIKELGSIMIIIVCNLTTIQAE